MGLGGIIASVGGFDSVSTAGASPTGTGGGSVGGNGGIFVGGSPALKADMGIWILGIIAAVGVMLT